LKLQGPADESPIASIEIEEPLQGGVIRLQYEFGTVQIAVQLSDTPNDCEASEFCDSVVDLCRCE
jgi:hypothetical protein